MSNNSLIQLGLNSQQNHIPYHDYMDFLSIQLLNISEGWFIQNFKQYTNSTPAQYLLSLRIHNAKVLLESTNYNVTEISNIIGYENPLYFSRIFKKQTGFSPSEYRKKIFSEDNSTHSVSIISPD